MSAAPKPPIATDVRGAHSLHRLVRWFSCVRIWERCWIIGCGISTENDGKAVLVQLGRWLIVIGPHYPPNETGQARREQPKT